MRSKQNSLVLLAFLQFFAASCFEYSYQKIHDMLQPIERPLVTAEYANFSSFDISLLTDTPPPFLTDEKTYTNSQILEALYKKYYFFLDGTPYLLDFPSIDVYNITIKINPCFDVDVEECIKRNVSQLQNDMLNVSAGPDMLIGWLITNYIITCGPEFADSPECGTYLEIHMPMNPNVIEEEKIEKNDINTYSYTFMSTKKLCGGSYEVWVVFRTRIGRIVQYVKPFFIVYPSCSCEKVKSVNPNYVC